MDEEIYGSINPPVGGFASEATKLGLDAEIAQRWKRGTQMAPFDKEVKNVLQYFLDYLQILFLLQMHLVLGVGVGGLCFSDSERKPWVSDDPKAQLRFYRSQDVWSKTWSDSSELVVDYVKVWAL